MTLLHVIYPDGRVQSAHYGGPLQFDAPPARHLAQLMRPPGDEIAARSNGDAVLVDHAVVLWQGRTCHMFVDNRGHAKSLPANAKATRIYWNATWRQMNRPELFYDDLERPSHIDPVTFEALPHEIRAEMLQLSTVVGVALLWEGEYS